MTWENRLLPPSYTSPSGVRTIFDYEDVSRTITKKGTAFNFPDASGTFVQDLGPTGRRYPLRIFIWGENYDLVASRFEASLAEIGTGRLEHPLYGAVDVVPLGDIVRRDDLKTQANQAVIQLTFWETTGLIYPTPQTDPESSVLSAIDDFNVAVSDAFGRITNLTTAFQRSSMVNSLALAQALTKTTLGAIADTVPSVRSQFNAQTDSLALGTAILVETDPVTLAAQTVLTVQTPGKADAAAIGARVAAYESIIAGLTDTIQEPGVDDIGSNTFHSADLYASSAVTGTITSALNEQFDIKIDAILTAEAILAQLDTVTVWRDANYASLGQIDTGEAYQQLQEAAAVAAGFLVQLSFTLKQERTIILDRPRNIIELTAELYGEVDEQLDFLISTNNLSGSEIIEIPRGRSIVYYI